MSADPTLQILVSLFIFAAGLGFGHWLAIGRDRRTALNEVSQRIRADFLKLRDRPGLAHVHSIDHDLYCRLAPFWKRWRFERAVARYVEATKAAQRRDSMGGVHYDKTSAVVKAHEAVLRATAWR